MPIVKAPFFSSSSSAGIGEVLTTKKHGSDTMFLRKADPEDANTLIQHQQRFKYIWYSNVWHFMTEPERLAWTPPSHCRRMTRYNYFMKTQLASAFPLEVYVPYDSPSPSHPYCTYRRDYIGLNFGGSSALGKVDECLYYDGTDDYGMISRPIYVPPAFTVFVYVKPFQLNFWGIILGRFFNWTSTDPWFIKQHATNFRTFLGTTGGAYDHSWPSTEGWSSICISWQPNTFQTWHNLVSKGISATSGTPRSWDGGFKIARRFSTSVEHYRGWIDHMVVGMWWFTEQERRALHFCGHAIFKELQP